MFLRNFLFSWTFRSHVRKLVTSSLNFLKSAFSAGHISDHLQCSLHWVLKEIKTTELFFPKGLSISFFFFFLTSPKEQCCFQKSCIECSKKFPFNIFLSQIEFQFRLLIQTFFNFMNKCYFPNLVVEIILEINIYFCFQLIWSLPADTL